MIYPKIPLAQSVLDICKTKGIQHIIISPGSRNAPLTIGFTNDPFFICYSVPDERCAAFFALGICQQIKKPVAVVCTSGSAVANYYPAVTEAYYSMLPLLIISADRPKNLVDIGDGQTIKQENIFGNHVVFNANLSEKASEENDILINLAINEAILKNGPSHINVPFSEPLYEKTSVKSIESIIVPIKKKETKLPLEEAIAASNIWNNAQKKMILIGLQQPDSESVFFINKLAEDPSVIILTETTSNCFHHKAITSIDTLISSFSEEEAKAFSPDLLVTFGGMIVSKRIKALLRKHKPLQHWHIDPIRAYDTYFCLTRHYSLTIKHFFETFLPYTISFQSEYQKTYLTQFFEKKERQNQFLSQLPFCDLKVFDVIAKETPENFLVHLGNSTPIRYAQFFNFHATTVFFCNRGTSGIDGATSTAIGAATQNEKPTLLITGDISFFYDSNGLWNTYIPRNFKIIVINNGGGGIFRILPGHQEEETFTRYFETSHCFTCKHLAAMYNFDYQIASDLHNLDIALKKFFSNTQNPQLLEIFTPTKENDIHLKNYFEAIKF